MRLTSRRIQLTLFAYGASVALLVACHGILCAALLQQSLSRSSASVLVSASLLGTLLMSRWAQCVVARRISPTHTPRRWLGRWSLRLAVAEWSRSVHSAERSRSGSALLAAAAGDVQALAFDALAVFATVVIVIGE